MRLPSKVISYKESTISSLPILLLLLKNESCTPRMLYLKTQDSFKNIGDFFDAILCLFALNKIKIDEVDGRITYVV
jgi:hypothetical protein